MKVYLAGGMRGYPSFNYPAFDAAAARLRAAGHEVFNPAEHDRSKYGELTPENADAKGFDLRKALAADLTWITLEADGVAVLDGWQASLGARAEVATALALGLLVQPANTFGIAHAWRVTELPPLPKVDTDNRAREQIQAHMNRFTSGRSVQLPGVLGGDDRLDGEVRSVSSTGGAKGVKAARMSLLPSYPLHLVAEHYAAGARKYSEWNWRAGYEFSKSFDALIRHAYQWNDGEDDDPETGTSHLCAVVFHAFTLLQGLRDWPQFDDRYRGVAA